ncbi:MAG: hypothetical protein GX633_00155 [Clostridiales bacterium]|nr:hypothetical protein [Clostridiales bacterium]
MNNNNNKVIDIASARQKKKNANVKTNAIPPPDEAWRREFSEKIKVMYDTGDTSQFTDIDLLNILTINENFVGENLLEHKVETCEKLVELASEFTQCSFDVNKMNCSGGDKNSQHFNVHITINEFTSVRNRGSEDRPKAKDLFEQMIKVADEISIAHGENGTVITFTVMHLWDNCIVFG